MIKTFVATIVYIAGIAGLFYLDRVPRARMVRVLWLPTIWFFILGSHPPSFWFGIGGQANMVLRYQEGNPFDATIFALLILAGIFVLAGRQRSVERLLRYNYAIVLFYLYCAISISWSDYPLVSFKRWIKTIGDLVMVLILATDPRPAEAVKRLLTRFAFVLLPLSVLFDKYYPNLSRSYSMDWKVMIGGVTDGKNELGVVCLVAGLGSLWALLDLWQSPRTPFRRRCMVAHGIILVLAYMLCSEANSMTSFSCLVMAGTVMFYSRLYAARRHPAGVHTLVWGFVGLSVFSTVIAPSAGLLKMLGRNPTLTGRTNIWHAVLSIHTNPLIGTGYEDFWMGSRLLRADALIGGGIQEAHNGYIELYLNLGWIGLILLGVMIATGYWTIFSLYRRNRRIGAALLAFFTAAVIYNISEAGFRAPGLIWDMFLLSMVLATEQFYLESHRRLAGRQRKTPIFSQEGRGAEVSSQL